MMHEAFLPTINASLNATATLLLLAGYIFIKRKNIAAHQRCMMSAFAVSCVFLVLYVTDKVIKGGAHTAFNATGLVRTAYYVMLISHVLLAMAVPVLAILLILFGLKGRIDKHRRLARWAWPIWMYVSVTGVLVYLALYVLNPAVP